MRARMIADRADFGSFGANVDMPAVVAFPCVDFAALENLPGIDTLNQLAIASLVLLLDVGDAFEKTGKLVEAFVAVHS